MPSHIDDIRGRLSNGPLQARQLVDLLRISQPSISRALVGMGGEVVRIGSAQSIQYALRDTARGLPDIPIYRVSVEGKLCKLGTLIPVQPNGFVMQQADGGALHSDGIPWWLLDMRPRGYLGRAYAARHAASLGLPERLVDWSDKHALQALIAHGHDVVGNVLLGDSARDHFLSVAPPEPIPYAVRPVEYARLAREAANGEVPGSSAGGEQPKFTAYVETPEGARHVIVKFTELDGGSVSERWRDLLLAEHWALDTLRRANISAAVTRIIDHAGQRFLEVERFDRVGATGRRALHSLAALDAEFVSSALTWWPVITRQLAQEAVIQAGAHDSANVLWAFGTLMGNSDMHTGNLSFVADQGRAYEIAPAYDMTPMAFRPTAGGGLTNTLSEATIFAGVDNDTWRRAEGLARQFFENICVDNRFSERFAPCIDALKNHIETASAKIERLA